MNDEHDDPKNKKAAFMGQPIFSGSFDPDCNIYSEMLPDGRTYLLDKNTKVEMYFTKHETRELAQLLKKLLQSMPLH